MTDINNILQHWNLSGTSAVQSDIGHKSTWDIDGKYVLKCNANASELSRSIKIAALLASEGIPVAAYITTTAKTLTTPDGTHCLMTKLPGSHIDFYARPDLADELGRGLALLHIALMHIEPKTECRDNDFIADWQGYIKPGLIGIPNNIAEHTESRILKVYEKLPRQPIHRDVHPQNVLFDNNKITGWLDFDLNRRDVRIFDLAYLFTGLLVGKIEKPSEVETWRILCREILAGYHEINPLTADEREAIPAFMIAIELLFVTFWNKQGNAENYNKAVELALWLYDEYKMKL